MISARPRRVSARQSSKRGAANMNTTPSPIRPPASACGRTPPTGIIITATLTHKYPYLPGDFAPTTIHAIVISRCTAMSNTTKYSSIAQLAEHSTVNRRVTGSSPVGGATKRPALRMRGVLLSQPHGRNSGVKRQARTSDSRKRSCRSSPTARSSSRTHSPASPLLAWADERRDVPHQAVPHR